MPSTEGEAGTVVATVMDMAMVAVDTVRHDMHSHNGFIITTIIVGRGIITDRLFIVVTTIVRPVMLV